MNIEKTTANFRLLGTNRFFKEPFDNTQGKVGRDFSVDAYRRLSDQDRMDLRLTRNLICNLLNVDSFNEIAEIFPNKEKKESIYKSFVLKYGAMYGFSRKSFEYTENRINRAIQEADLVINTLENHENGLLRHLKTSIGMTNEISVIKNPIDLFLIMFSPKASRRLRYEARRKLVFMDLSFRSSLEADGFDKQIDNLVKFLNTNVFEGGLGVTDTVEILSQHSPLDYSCEKVDILRSDEKITPSAYKRYTKYEMRRWKNQHGIEKHVYMEQRLKNPFGKVLKLMRKDTKNPGNIDDYLGFKLVFESKRDIFDFLDTLERKYFEAGSLIYHEEPYDTIANGDDFRLTNPGSSNNLEIVKVHLVINAYRVELQMHTFRTYLDSRYHDERGFEVYAIKRLFEGAKNNKGEVEPGAIDFPYPSDIFDKDVLNSEGGLLNERKTAIRNAALYIPKERTKQGYIYEKYTSEEFLVDMINIVQQLEEYPEQIIAVGVSGHFMAAQLSKLLGGVPIIEYNENLEGIDKNKRSLVVNGLTKDARRIKKLKEILPDSKVAVIAERLEEETKSLVNYRARKIEPNIWFHYYWEIPDIDISFAQGIALFYRINKKGQIEFLVEELKNRSLDNKNLKLIGGKHEKREPNLSTTILRELKEETGKKYKRSNFIPLDNLSFDFKPDLNKDIGQADIKKGFAQAFTRKVNDKFNLPIKEQKETRKHVWVTVDEFKKRSMWQSYISCIDRWITQIQEIEKASKNQF